MNGTLGWCDVSVGSTQWDVKHFNLKLPLCVVIEVYLSVSRLKYKLDFLDYQLDSKLLHVYTQRRWSYNCVHT